MAGFGDEKVFYCPSLDDDGNGTNTLNDLSGNNWHATAVGSPQWISNTGSGGVRAIQFDSNGLFKADQLSLISELLSHTSGTIGLWFYDNLTSSTERIISLQDGPAFNANSYIGISSDRRVTNGREFYRITKDGANEDVVRSPTPFQSWTNVVWWSDGTKWRVYENGVQKGSDYASSNWIENLADAIDTPDRLLIGEESESSYRSDFLFDDLRIWDYAITEQYITDWYNGGRGYTVSTATYDPLGGL